MHLFLTDRLSCPRCGPGFGLILLAREVRERRVLQGDLGCPNCRETYPVEDGFGDLRSPPREPLSEVGSRGGASEMAEGGEGAGAGSREAALRMAALLGVTEGPGTLLVKGPAANLAGGLAGVVEGVEVVAVDPSVRFSAEEEGVSRMVARPGLPFFSGSLRGVLLSGGIEDHDIREAVRVLVPRGRVAVLGALPEARARLEEEGTRILLHEEGVLVGERLGPPEGQLVTLRGP